MSLTQCPDCAGRVSTQAKRCPHCGLKVRFDWGKVGLVFVVLAIMYGIAARAYIENSIAGAVILGAISLFITSVVLVALVDQ